MDKSFNQSAATKRFVVILLIAAVTFAGCGTTDSPLEEVTPVDPIAESPSEQCFPASGGAPGPLDLNGDEVDDFWFGYHHYQTHDVPSSGASRILHFRPVNGAAIHHGRLQDGDTIDGSIAWSGWQTDIASIHWSIHSGWDCYWRSGWAGIDRGNLPLRITIDGSYHYGWAQMSFNDTTGVLTLHDYAWQSIPDFWIKAGMPPTSGS